MASWRSYVIFLLVTQTCVIIGQTVTRTSLTFVIDDTGSMWNEIDQVKSSVNSIFDTVMYSNLSQIDNFILVTFNDPDALLLTVTKDRTSFRHALNTITVHGGDDCPEYAMKGIKIGLEKSLPLSTLYVFTDASAKDNSRLDEIKSIAQRKQIQVTFLLTGKCGSRDDPQYQAYYNLAQVTSGEVFNMMKQDVKDILEYVKENIKGRSNELASEKFSPGYGKKFNFTVDGKTSDVMVSVTGLDPAVKVTDEHGKEVKTDPVVTKSEISIVKVVDSKPGVHVAEVGSKSDTFAKVTGKTTVNFHHGFSPFEPNSLSETASRPAADGNAYLAIQLEGEEVKFETAKILDMSGNVIKELPLRLKDKRTNFYVTDLFDPPRTTFRVAVSGYDEKTKSPLQRIAPTPIERRNPAHETIENAAPITTIEGGPKIVTTDTKPIQVKCKVHGYPKPEITWQEKTSGAILPTTILTIEEPYEYMSILEIKEPNKNSTYECKATNPQGVSINYIEIESKGYFNIVKVPKAKKQIKFGQEDSIECKVDALPPATITWYKDGRSLDETSDVSVSSDMTTLTINYMTLTHQGKYTCEAKNEMRREVFDSKVVIVGLEKPVINKTNDEIYGVIDGNSELTCSLIRGVPEPTIQWYYQQMGGDDFIELEATDEVLLLEHVTTKNAGFYKCKAKNALGSESYTMQLIIKYPPTIKDDNFTRIEAKEGEAVNIPCEVDGEPSPKVKWLKEGRTLTSTRGIRVTTTHNLKFRAISIANTGEYTCEASNMFGSTKKTVFVDVIDPVSIEVPKKSLIETVVGEMIILPCNANGYPEPEIKWIFRNRKTSPRELKFDERSKYFSLLNTQLRDEGYYSCVASNVGGSSSITYEVIVNAPPVIRDIYPEKTFKVVKGDLALRIQCRVTGKPKPTVTWKRNDLNIAFGTEWFDLDLDGTLVIKNIDEASQGKYVCQAQNKVGKDTMEYNVVVNGYPIPEKIESDQFFEEGSSAVITCDIPHKKSDLLRWYKDSKQIAVGELSFSKISRSDGGIYSCRVSDTFTSRTANVRVTVGYKPFFITAEEEVIEFVEGSSVPLICEADGDPYPEVSWKIDGRALPENEMTYHLEMTFDNRGVYTCEVSNPIGTIQRTFTMITKDCILDRKKDFVHKNSPLILSTSLTWPSFDIDDRYMFIENEKLFYLHCPNKFDKFPAKYVRAFCEGGTKIKIEGNVYDYTEIECTDEPTLTVQKTGRPCLKSNTELVEIGYSLLTGFIKVYEICVDKNKNVPVYAYHELASSHYGVSNNDTKWFSHDLLPLSFDTVYDCYNQVNDISSTLGTDFHLSDGCCFDKRQLVNPKDLRLGVPTSAAYTYLNIVPHWSTCNSNNWAEVEEKVRNLANYLGNDLDVWTGTATPSRRAHRHVFSDLVLHDERGAKQAVGDYLWKVVQDPESSSSLAIIQVNVPDLSPADATLHVHCRDICNEVEWMRSANWHNVSNGYTYCCDVREFESAFGFHGKFGRSRDAILNSALTPKYYSLSSLH